MKRATIPLILISLIFILAGCFTLNVVGTPADVPFSLSNHPAGTVVKSFSKTLKVHHFVYGLVTPFDPTVAKAIADEVKAAGGTHAINVKIRYQMTFLDGLINVITFGTYVPFTLTIEGDVVR